MTLRIQGGFSADNPSRPSRAVHFRRRLALLAGLVLASSPWANGEGPASSPYRGLWAGQVTLNYVNEIPVPLDKDNNPVAPDPEVATPTYDQAHLRLILHVDGAGQVRLLRDVAVLARTANSDSATPVNVRSNSAALVYKSSLLVRESDMSLVTDERLYGEFPAQPATRIASAVFDFGDDRATRAVQAVIDEVARAAASLVLAGSAEATAGAEAAGKTKVVQRSDVAAEFSRFLAEDLRRSRVDLMAVGNTGERAAALTAAQSLLNWSPFFKDYRAINMVSAINDASDALPVADEDGRRKVAQNTAAAHADLTDGYSRFLAGKQLGDMIGSGALSAAAAAMVPGATAGSIALAVNGNSAVRAARGTATSLDSVSSYADTRSGDAVNTVTAAIVSKAAELVAVAPQVESEIAKEAEEAGFDALARSVPRYLVPAIGPTTDYNEFIKSPEYLNSPKTAAVAAVEAATEALSNNPFLTEAELIVAASDAATDALREGTVNAFSKAAVAARRELPLQGQFGAGVGDPRFSFLIKRDRLPPLAPAGLFGELFLPAGHPTNPFRHRRHPDHKYGYDLARRIRLDFDAGPPGPTERAGYGVSRISGVYREEIFGLHKPLGPRKDLGLRVEGRFELNRISLIDALNAR